MFRQPNSSSSFGIFEVLRVKAFGEPVVDRGEQLVGFCCLALTLPQAGQAGGGAEF